MTAPHLQPLADPPDPPRRVLIVKPSSLGDVVTALPVLRALRRTHPDAHLAWLLSTACGDLLDDETDLDDIVPFDRKRLGKAGWYLPATIDLLGFRRRLRRGSYDWTIDLQGLFRSGLFTAWTRASVRAGFADAREGAARLYNRRIQPLPEHTVDRNIELARSLGLDARPGDMTLPVGDDARAAVRRFLADRDLQPGRFLVAVPPTRWATKRYPVRHWRRVVADLADDLPVVLAGSPAPEERALCAAVAEGQPPGVVDLAGQTSIAQFVALLADSAGVLCCDSAAKFITPAVGKDCVVLLGPTRIERTGPYLRGRALAADVSCRGCLKKRCPHITCMQSIAPADVTKAVRVMLSSAQD